MFQSEEIEELVCLISNLDRPALTRQILEFSTVSFPIDFSPEFLGAQSVERLRHLLFALCIQSKRTPMEPTPRAA